MLEQFITKAKALSKNGKVANYIPELSKAKADAAGLCIVNLDGEVIFSGDSDYKFTMQSISKTLIFLKVLEDNRLEDVKQKISFLPTTEAFNSIFQLETKNANKPLNPFINAGAILAVSMLKGDNPEEKFAMFMDFCKTICGNENLKVNEKVYESEKLTGDRNRSLAYYMKSTGVLEKDVTETLDVYFRICSIEVTCRDIAFMGACLANGGTVPGETKHLVSKKNARIVRTVMSSCGLYEESGDFMVNVGIPAKSGVGGGIMCSVPGKCGVGVVGPALNAHGNSVAGLYLLENLSEFYGWSIF